MSRWSHTLATVVVATACRSPDGGSVTGDGSDSTTQEDATSDGSTVDTSSSGDALELGPLFGGAQKGPLVLGSSITAIRLAESGQQEFAGIVESDAGDFDLGEVPTGLYSLEAEGFAFDELRGQLGQAPITLRSFVAVAPDSGPSYVNVLTHLVQLRARALVDAGTAPDDALVQAQAELVAVLPIGLPDLAVDAPASGTTLLDGDGEGPRYLLAVSAVLASAALLADDHAVEAELQQSMNTIAADFEDGTLDGQTIATLSTALLAFDPDVVEQNLAARLVDLGLPADTPDLDLVLDQDRDLVLNADDVCPRVADPEQLDTDADGFGDRCDRYPLGDPEVMLTDPANPSYLAIGAESAYVASTTQGAPGTGTIWRVPKDGVDPTQLATFDGMAMHVFVTDTFVYFDAFIDAPIVHRTLLDGTSDTILAGAYPVLGVDATYVYRGYGTLYRSAHGDDQDEPLATLGGGAPSELAIGSDALAFTTQIGNVQTVPIDGGTPEVIDTIVGAAGGIAIEGDQVYWMDRLLCELHRVPVAGGASTTLWTYDPGDASMECSSARIAIAGGYVYWGALAAVLRMSTRGGEVEIVANGDLTKSVVDVQLDDTHVWWLNADGGTLVRVPTPL